MLLNVRSVAQLSPIFATSWTVGHQAPLSVKFSKQEYWSGLSFSSLEYQGIEFTSLVPPALAGKFFTTAPAGKSYAFK